MNAKVRGYKPTAKHNDPKWYTTYPELTNSAGHVTHVAQAGRPLDWIHPMDAEMDGNKIQSTYPTILAASYVPTIGVASALDDAINRMCYTLKNAISAKTHRSTSVWESTDLGVYIIAMNSAVACYYTMKRIVDWAFYTSVTDVSYPDVLMAAMYVNGQDIRDHRHELREYLLYFGNMLKAFPFPETFALFQRTAALCSNVYKESAVKKSATYLFRYDGWYIFDDMHEGGSALKYFEWKPQTGLRSATDMVNAMRAMIDSITQSASIEQMTSDIWNCWPDTAVVLDLPIEEEATPAFVVDDNVARTTLLNFDVRGYVDTSTLEVYQGPTFHLKPVLWCQPHGWVRGPIAHSKHFLEVAELNKSASDLRPEEIIDYTRGMVVYGDYTGEIRGTGSNQFRELAIASCGTEIPNGLSVYAPNYNGSGAYYTEYSVNGMVSAGGFESTCLASVMPTIMFGPKLYVGSYNSATSKWDMALPMWPVNDYVYLTDQQLVECNNAALYNLFNAYAK